jgi:hypothetical protein
MGQRQVIIIENCRVETTREPEPMVERPCHTASDDRFDSSAGPQPFRLRVDDLGDTYGDLATRIVNEEQEFEVAAKLVSQATESHRERFRTCPLRPHKNAEEGAVAGFFRRW